MQKRLFNFLKYKQTMSAFYVTTKEGKRLYVKTFDKSKGEIEWTENKRGQLYRREDSFY